MTKTKQNESDTESVQGEDLYFDQEAQEGNETESDASDVMGPGNKPLTKRGKKAMKICRHFSYSLITNAVECGWEDQEVANLIKLVAEQLDFDSTKLIRCLEQTTTGSPSILSNILEDSDYNFTIPQTVSVILCHAKSVDHFIALMGESLECGLFDLTYTETIDVLHSFIENNMDYRESQRYARQLCEHASNKRICGKILHKFTSTLSPGEAASYVYDLITLDFFQDITGTMKDFLANIPNINDEVEALLDATHDRDKDGELIDSDADSNGNLKDFLASSEDEGERGSEQSSAGDSGSEDSNSSDSRSASDSDDDDEEEEEMEVWPHRRIDPFVSATTGSTVTAAAASEAPQSAARKKEKAKKQTTAISSSNADSSHNSKDQSNFSSNSKKYQHHNSSTSSSSDNPGSSNHRRKRRIVLDDDEEEDLGATDSSVAIQPTPSNDHHNNDDFDDDEDEEEDVVVVKRTKKLRKTTQKHSKAAVDGCKEDVFAAGTSDY